MAPVLGGLERDHPVVRDATADPPVQGTSSTEDLHQQVQRLQCIVDLLLVRFGCLVQHTCETSKVRLPSTLIDYYEAMTTAEGMAVDSLDVFALKSAPVVVISNNNEADTAKDAAPEAAESAQPVTASMLDKGDMYTAGPSMWSTFMFVGLDCTGLGCSIWIVFVGTLNIVLQGLFCYVIYFFMGDDDPVAESRLNQLYFFRAAVGHDILYADRQGDRSMLTLCDGEASLHISNLQYALFDNLSLFTDGGHLLMILAQIVWLADCFREITDAYFYGQSLRSLERGRVSVISSNIHDERELLAIEIVTKWKSMSLPRVVLLHLFVIIPRMFTAIFLWFAGIFFLAITADLNELMLNAIALNFVLNIDEVLFQIMIPRRTQTLLANLQPIKMEHGAFEKKVRMGWVPCLARLVILSALIIAVNTQLVDPFFDRIRAAMSILCDGNLDFVYATDPITQGVKIIQTSNSQRTLSNAQRAVLQYALPEGISPDVCEGCESTLRFSNVAYLRTQSHGLSLDGLFALSSSDLHLKAQTAPCNDGAIVDSTQHLQLLLSSATGVNTRDCQEARDFCWRQEMGIVRILCPKTCGCEYKTSFPYFNSNYGAVGAFDQTRHGCPLSCFEGRNTWDLDYSKRSDTFALGNCIDKDLTRPEPQNLLPTSPYSSIAKGDWASNLMASYNHSYDWIHPYAVIGFYEFYIPGMFQFFNSTAQALKDNILAWWNLGYFNLTAKDADDIVLSITDGRTEA
eukprot:TRINITY_DN18073_c0_g1_i1.p1 TRINITY_DN18073_c0_g1~~TRINITY_DN18073_c0_g1_i1.p1  ORF type:complete len:742 (+),score=87.44 TRINITY_DN18073_c0_g1_i1:67-2292(+)